MRRPLDKKKPRRKKTSTTPVAKIIFLLSILVIAQLIFLSSDFFRLRSIEIIGSNRVTHKEIMEAAVFPWGRNIVALNLKPYHDKIENMLWIKEAQVTRIYPGGVVIEVTERTPVISAAYEKEQEERYAVDDEGVVLFKIEEGKRPDLPNLLLEKKIKVGDTVDQDMVDMISKFYTNWLDRDMMKKITAFQIENKSHLSFYYTPGERSVEVKLGELENIEQKMEILEQIIKEMAGKEKELLYVDLRYKEPVVRLKEDTPEQEKEGKRPQDENT